MNSTHEAYDQSLGKHYDLIERFRGRFVLRQIVLAAVVPPCSPRAYPLRVRE